MQCTGKELRHRLGRKFEPPPIRVDKIDRYIGNKKSYTAIVYEFITEAPNDYDIVQSVLSFLWLAGFSHTLSPQAVNWTNSVLVDGSEITGPKSYGWDRGIYEKLNPEAVLKK